MERKDLCGIITKLDGMIAALDQAIVLGGRTRLEREAGELLKEARIKLIQEIESRRPRAIWVGDGKGSERRLGPALKHGKPR